MELIERAESLLLLEEKFNRIAANGGQCALVCGEAGTGKTSLLNAFCQKYEVRCQVYQGTCDDLLSPRPLAPFYDIALQMGGELWGQVQHAGNRSELFLYFFNQLYQNRERSTVILFEDIHWADEATLDFIHFFARRITQLNCFFILTYRDDEIGPLHPLRNILGQLIPGTFCKLQLAPLSRDAVNTLSIEKGYSGQHIYDLTGGNPFYVQEILANYSDGVPEQVKDAILSVFNRKSITIREMWQVLSVFPNGLEICYLKQITPQYMRELADSMEAGLLLIKSERLFFKHELYRRTIEQSLSPIVRIELNKKVLVLLRSDFERKGEFERIIHHAQHAADYDLILQFAARAARKASDVGAHLQALNLYLLVIANEQHYNESSRLPYYEGYVYECYLTNHIEEAITYQEKLVSLRQNQNNDVETGNAMRFLSRLWWFAGNRQQAEHYGSLAVELFENQPSSGMKAMALSNMSQLNMLAGKVKECKHWGRQACRMAKAIEDKQVLSHALNNIGTIDMNWAETLRKGARTLQQSLDIALHFGYQEHAARAYTNLAHNRVISKNFDAAEKMLNEGIAYCEKQDLNSWADYMRNSHAALKLETGEWAQAHEIASTLIVNSNQTPIIAPGALTVIATINMRKGDLSVLETLTEAKNKAFQIAESQRIFPIMSALLEYEWLTSQQVIDKESIEATIGMIYVFANYWQRSEFVYWLYKVRGIQLNHCKIYEGYSPVIKKKVANQAALWGRVGCPYMQALFLAEGNQGDKKKALIILQQLRAKAVYQKLTREMRRSGVKTIPRGLYRTSLANNANLTGREIEVLQLLKTELPNKIIADQLFISAKTVGHHISSILLKLDVKSRTKAVQKALTMNL